MPANFIVQSPTTILVMVPSGLSGSVDVSVTKRQWDIPFVNSLEGARERLGPG